MKKIEHLTKEMLEDSYNELKNLTAMGKKFGVSRVTIAYYMDAYGLKREIRSKFKCNELIFSTDTEISFYLAGFIAADGCVFSKGSSKVLSFGLSQKDKSHLEKIKSGLGANHPIGDYVVKNKKQNPNWNDTIKSELRIYSEKIYSDLKRFNITERKTHTLTFPEWIVDHPLRHHFIRGYVDGDGSFYSSLGKDKKVKQVCFSLRGTSQFLTSLRGILEDDLNLDKRAKDIRFNNGIGVLEYGGNRLCKKIAEYLYKDATIYLDRKKEAAFAFEGWDTKEFFEDKNISKEKLQEIYFREKSTQKTGKEIGVSSATILKYLAKYEIEIFESPQAKRERFMKACTPEALKASYEKHGTISGVAREFEISKNTASRYLKSKAIIS